MKTTARALMITGLAALSGCGASADDPPSQEDQAFIIPTPQLAAPRLVAPLSTATATSRIARLRWRLAAGEQGARVELCRDPGCHHREYILLAFGSELSLALHPGVYFWRAWGFRGLFRSAEPSATWELRVPPRFGAVPSSYGHAADYNRDGYSDLAIPASDVGGPSDRVYVYYGSPSGLRARPGGVLLGLPLVPRSLEWGATSFDLDAGDLNGDGFSDAVVRARESAFTPAQLYVYYGTPAGLAPLPSRVLQAVTTPGYEHGYSFGAAGDLDGDGYGDLATGDISVPEQYDDNAGFVHVYRGGAGGVGATPDTTLAEGIRERLVGWALAAGGNFDADPYADLLVTSPQRSFGLGRFEVFPGSATGLSLDTRVEVPNPDPRAGSKMGDAAAMAGDINGDGYCDAVVAQAGQSIPGRRYLVYFGGASGLATAAGQAVSTVESPSHFGRAIAGGGDVNGDGYSDLAATVDTGEVQLFLGGPAGYALPAASTVAVLSEPPAGFWSVSITHDFNGDGRADLYARAKVFYGRATGLPTAPSVTLRGP